MAARKFDLLTEEGKALLDEIVKGVRSGLPVITAASRLGVSGQRITDWKMAGLYGTHSSGTQSVSWRYQEILRDFANRLEVAKAEWEAEHFQSIAAQALGDLENKPQWKASAWILNNHPDTRKTYRQEKNAIEDRREALPIYQQVAALSDEELQALASGNPDTTTDNS